VIVFVIAISPKIQGLWKIVDHHQNKQCRKKKLSPLKPDRFKHPEYRYHKQMLLFTGKKLLLKHDHSQQSMLP